MQQTHIFLYLEVNINLKERLDSSAKLKRPSRNASTV